MAISRTLIAAAGTRSRPAGRAGCRRAVGLLGRRPEDRHVAGMRHGRGIAPRLIHSTTPSRRARSTTRLANACHRSSGSGPASTSRSRSLNRTRRTTSSGQVSSASWPSMICRVGRRRAVVEERVGIEGGDIDRVVEQLFEGGGRGAAGIDPAVEGGDERWCDQVSGIARTARSGQRVEAHRRSLRGDGRRGPHDERAHLVIQ